MNFYLYRCDHCGTVKALTSTDITDRVHTSQRGFDCDMIKALSTYTYAKCGGALERMEMGAQCP
jgi:hypothetical protein